MVQLLFSQKELGVYTHDAERESTPALLFYNLKTNESSLKEIPIPERRTVVEEEISDTESIEIFYGMESVVLTDDYVVLSFTACKRRFKTDGSGELLYIDPHIYLYSREGEFVKDIRLEDSVKYDAVLEPYQHRLMADGEYIYALSCVAKISSATKEREREVFEGPDNPYPWILAIYDYDGKLLEEREVTNGSGLLNSPQGIILNDGTNLRFLTGLKEEQISFAEKYDYLIQSGDQDYLFCYRRRNGVFGYRSDTGKPEQIFKDDSEQMAMFDFAESAELAYSYYYEGSLYRSLLYNDSDRLFILRHGKRSKDTDKNEQNLVIATVGSDMIPGNLKAEFSRKHPEISIEVREFENSEKIMEAIGRGDQIDLVDMGSMNMDVFTSKDLLVDLYPLIEADNELEKTDFIDEVISIFEMDGKLYEAFTGYFPITILGKESVVPENGEWNYDVLMQTVARTPNRFYRQELLDYAFSRYRDRIINLGETSVNDLEPHNCNFRQPDFEKAFVETKGYPSFEEILANEEAQPDMVDFMNQRGFIAYSVTMNDLTFLSYHNANKMDSIRILGYPEEDGNYTYLSETNRLGILANSNNRELAWDFVRPMFTTGYQVKECYRNGFFPTRKDVLEILNRTLCASEEYEEEYLGTVPAYESKEAFGFTYSNLSWKAADMKDIEEYEKDLLTAKKYLGKEKAYSILLEEADGYWIGGKNAGDCLDIANSRVGIWLRE